MTRLPPSLDIRRFRRALLPLAALLGALTLGAGEVAPRLDIPRGSARQTLKLFAAQAQCEMVFAPELVGDVTTNAVRGTLTPQAALSQMLGGTPLIATQDSTGAFAIRRAAIHTAPNRTTPPFTATPQQPTPEILRLSPFLVPAGTLGRYTAAEATSGTRVRVSLLDSPQSISVITRDLIDDIGAGRVLDAAKYVAGVSESTIPNAQDRTNLRGFQTDGATIDGFNFFTYANIDPVIVDRIEVVKGPNAVLSPQIVQGTINLVSRKPEFSNHASVSGQLGRYDANRLEFDFNRVLQPGTLAVRIVGAAQHSHNQAEGNFNHSQIVMPTVTYAFGSTAALTIETQFYNAYTAAYGGLPIDPDVGTNDPARLLRDIPTELDLYTTMAARHSVGAHYRLFFTAKPTEHLSVRLAANAIRWHGTTVGISLGTPISTDGISTATLALDPETGAWVRTGLQNTFPIYPRGGTVGYQSRTYLNLQNDYAYERELAWFKSTTLAGAMLDYLKNPGTSTNLAMPALAIRSNPGIRPYTLTTENTRAVSYISDDQVYLTEVLTSQSSRLVLSGGVAQAWYKSYVSDLLRHRTATHTPNALLPNAGVVLKVLPPLALFADLSRQSTAIAPSTTASTPSDLQTGRQYEIGARTQLNDGRVFASAAYFSVTQSYFAVPNPGNAAVPAPAPALPPLFMDLRITGFEFELRAALSASLAIVGSASFLHARNPVGQPFRGVAERTAAVWIDYAFNRRGPWYGLSLGLGLDYLGRRAGDVPSSNPTSGSTLDHLILPQPSFWLPARTLLSFGMTYRLPSHWRLQLNIDNLLNAHYLAASTSRNTVFPGTPFNPRVTITYAF